MLMFYIHGICVRFLGIKTGKPLETLAVFGLQSFRPHVLVGEDGFEPSKRYAADLQSVPFGHSGTPPYYVLLFERSLWLEPVDGLEPPTY